MPTRYGFHREQIPQTTSRYEFAVSEDDLSKHESTFHEDWDAFATMSVLLAIFAMAFGRLRFVILVKIAFFGKTNKMKTT